MTTMNDGEREALDAKQQGGAAQSAPAGEREAFEAWHCEKFKNKWNSGRPTRDMHNGVYDDKYAPEHQQNMWEAHQAGAAWQRAQGAVPEGWKLVPIEPTEAMREAFNHVDAKVYRQSNRTLFKGKHSWSAMLAAAPAHPTERQEHGEVQRLRAELVKRIQAAISSVVMPATLTPSRAEYYKAGARHIIAKVNEALSASTGQEAAGHDN